MFCNPNGVFIQFFIDNAYVQNYLDMVLDLLFRAIKLSCGTIGAMENLLELPLLRFVSKTLISFMSFTQIYLIRSLLCMDTLLEGLRLSVLLINTLKRSMKKTKLWNCWLWIDLSGQSDKYFFKYSDVNLIWGVTA